MAKKEVILYKLVLSSNNKLLQTFVVLGGIALSWLWFRQNKIISPFWLMLQCVIIVITGVCYLALIEKVYFSCPYCKTGLQVANEPIAVDCPRCKERILIKWK